MGHKKPNVLFVSARKTETPSMTVRTLGDQLAQRDIEWGVASKNIVSIGEAAIEGAIPAGHSSADFDQSVISAMKLFKRSSQRDAIESIPITNPDWVYDFCIDKMKLPKAMPDSAIPTLLLSTSQSTRQSVENKVVSAIKDFSEYDHFVVKPRSGQRSEGVQVFSAEELLALVTDPGFNPSIWEKNMILQPFVDRVNGDKPYLKPEYKGRSSILRFIVGGVFTPDNRMYTGISGAYYRIDPAVDDRFAIAEPDNESEQFLLPDEGKSMTETYPLLDKEIYLAHKTVESVLDSEVASEYARRRTEHGFRSLHMSVDIIQSVQGPLILEINSTPQRTSENDMTTRLALQITEADVIAATAHRTVPSEHSKI